VPLEKEGVLALDRSEATPPGGELDRRNAPTQFVWYVLVGGVSFLVDLSAFTILLSGSVPVLLALVGSFILGTLVNYILCRALAFTGGRYRRSGEIVRLSSVALVGLVLTATLVWGFIALGITPIAARVIATPVALAWNYVGRRLFVFHHEMPTATWRASQWAHSVARNTVLRQRR
jgi:putative flippase GtrA